MACTTMRFGNGGVAIVCTRGRRGPKCSVCRERPAERLCDGFMVTPDGLMSDACSVQLCVRCTTTVPAREGLGDLCPACAEGFRERVAIMVVDGVDELVAAYRAAARALYGPGFKEAG